MAIAPFPTLARAATRITSELWIVLRQPPGPPLRGTEIGGAHVVDARDAIAHPDALLDAWLAVRPELTCCDLRIGMQLYADGALWTGGAHDHFWHLAGWAQLGIDLLASRPSSTLVGDERALRSRIEGERAMIWDARALTLGLRDAWWPIRCERVATARAIAEAGSSLDALRTRVIESIDRRADRRTLPRFDVAEPTPRAADPLGRLALIDHEVTRRLDPLAFRELTAALRT